MQFRFETKDQCVRLRLHPGAVIRCASGRLWITMEPRRPRLESPDIQLTGGECLRVDLAGDYFVSSIDVGVSSCCIVDVTGERAGWLQSLLRRFCAPASFLIQDATTATSLRGCSSAWSSQYRFGLGTLRGEGTS
jgi:hypothetical protein